MSAAPCLVCGRPEGPAHGIASDPYTARQWRLLHDVSGTYSAEDLAIVAADLAEAEMQGIGELPSAGTMAALDRIADLANRVLVQKRWGTDPVTGERYR